VSARFEELDWRTTPLGDLSLRRRHDPALGADVYEAKLDDEFLMSSHFTVAEEELARLGLAAADGDALDVVVGGLGLGYTARAALEDPRVRSLVVVESLAAVVSWHEKGLLPCAEALTSNPRTRFVEGDFFALAWDGSVGPGAPDRRVHAVLLDIDHTPRHVLHPSHAAAYTPDGLRRLATRLHPEGVLAVWSDDPPDAEFEHALGAVFAHEEAHVVTFPNRYTGGESANTVYVARHPTRRDP
jgi:spermidine synthase